MTPRPPLTTIFGLLLLLLSSSHSSSAEPSETLSTKHLFNLSSDSTSKLKLPTDIAISQGNIFVVDSGNNRIVGFQPSGRHLLSFGRKGSARGEFRNPVGIGADRDGNLYVADKDNHRIQVFNADGDFMHQFPVTSNGQKVRPIDVAVAERGNRVYVTGNNSHNLLLFKKNGAAVTAWGQEGIESGEFRYPATVITLPGDRVGVIDVLNTRLQIFNKQGEYRASIGVWGVLPGQLFRPKGVAIDAKGRLYISDSYMNVLQVFEDTGRFLYVLKQDGSDHELRTPTGMTIDANQRLYVAEMRNNLVSVYQLDK